MIKNLQNPNLVHKLKVRVMLLIARIIKRQLLNSVILQVLFNFLQFLCFSSILFMNNPLDPQQSNLFFKIFVVSSLHRTIGTDQSIELTALIIFMSSMLLLITANFMSNPPSWVVSWLSYGMPLLNVICVPIMWGLTEKIGDFCTQFPLSLVSGKAVYVVESVLVILVMLVYTYFQISPLRHSNLLWSYTSDKQFSHLLLNLLKPILLGNTFQSQTQTPLILLLLFLILQLRTLSMPSPYFIKTTAVITNCKHTLMCILHASLILGLLFDDKKIAFVVLVVGCGVNIGISVLEFINIKQQSQEIPACQENNCIGIYSFYVGFKYQTKNSIDDLIKRISVHYYICNHPQCIFKDINHDSTLGKLTIDDFQQKMTKFFKIFRHRTPQSELLYQIWKIQLNKTINLSHKLRQFSIRHQFIVNYILGPDNSKSDSLTTAAVSEATSSTSSLNSQSLSYKWKFYKQIGSSVQQFGKLGEILSKPISQLNEILDTVITISHETNHLKSLFDDMISKKEVNYLCISLYLKFYQCFLGQGRISVQTLNRLKRLKIYMDPQTIQENSLPCLIVQGHTKTVQRMNAQCLKFLRCHRYEIKDKNLHNFIMPTLSPKQLYQLQVKNEKDDSIPIFFKVKTSTGFTTVCRDITLKPSQINNKNYFEITVLKKNHDKQVAELLIDEKQNILVSSMEFITIPFRHGNVETNIHDVFKQKIKPILEDIGPSKIGRIEFGDRCLVSGIVLQRYCQYPKMKLIALNFVNKINVNRNNKRVSNARLSAVYCNTDFTFSYRYSVQENAILQGSRYGPIQNQKSNVVDTISIRTLNQKLPTMIAGFVFFKQQFGGGIKTYRLYDGDLYNIDLQDKTKYEQEFDGIQQSMVGNKLLNLNININLFIAVVVLVACIILGCNIYLSISADQKLSTIQDKQNQLLEIQQFSLNFNRIMAVMRDAAAARFNGTMLDYRQFILNSYDELQKIDSTAFLSQTICQGKYKQETYSGTLSELIQVSLTHVYQFLQTGDDSTIQDIHSFTLVYIGPQLANEKVQKRQQIEDLSTSLKDSSLICFIITVSSCGAYFVLLLIVSYKFKKNFNDFLYSLLISTEAEIRHFAEEADKFKNILSSLYKNYEIQLDSLLERKNAQKKRNRPKRTNLGFSTILLQFFSGGILVSLLIILSTIHYNSILSQTDRVGKLSKEGQAILQTYSGLCWITNKIDHLGVIDYDLIDDLSSQLDLIQDDKNNYEFSDELSQHIKMVFFNSSCSYLVDLNVLNGTWCGNFIVDYAIQDPFKMSLDIYFRRMVYNLVVNLEQAMAPTGIYSQPFKQVFKFFAASIQSETTQIITDIRGSLLSVAVTVVCISFMLIVVVAVATAYFQYKMKDVEKGLITVLGDQGKNCAIQKAITENAQNKQDPKQNQNKDEDTKNNQKTRDLVDKVQQSDALISGNEQIDSIREQQ